MWAPSSRYLRRCGVAVACLAGASALIADPALARPRDANTTTAQGRLHALQPVSYRLLGMGGLDLAVRDGLNRTNLYQFGGISAGLGVDRDSTSLDLRAGGEGATRDVLRGDRTEEIARSSESNYELEGILRFSETLAFGADLALPTRRGAVPYDNLSNTSTSYFEPAANVMMSGRLFGPVLWGLNALFAGRNFSQDWWQNQLQFRRNPWTGETSDYRWTIGTAAGKIEAPNFFAPSDGRVRTGGFGGSIAYQYKNRGEAAFYVLRSSEDVHTEQSGERRLYDTEEKRQPKDFGFAVVARPSESSEAGVTMGRSTWNSSVDYRFSLSGGSTGIPVQSRGDRSLHKYRADYLDGRYQGAVLVDGLTLGADVRVGYERAHEAPATTPGNFNDFVLSTATVDTLIAPPLVYESVRESRDLGFGAGASYTLPQFPVLVGVEYHWRREAQHGTLHERRPQGWNVRLGGEWMPNETWAGRLGWVHDVGDADRLTPLNEGVADRFTMGGTWQAQSGWTADGFVQAAWGRTEYADPLGALEKGWALGFSLGRLF